MEIRLGLDRQHQVLPRPVHPVKKQTARKPRTLSPERQQLISVAVMAGVTFGVRKLTKMLKAKGLISRGAANEKLKELSTEE